MKSKKVEDARDKFMRLYPNLPLGERYQTIAILDINGKNEPFSWRFVYDQLTYNTELGDRLLEQIVKLDILGDVKFKKSHKEELE